MKNILLVEDDETSLYITTRLLKKLYPGVSVIPAENGLIALNLLRKLAIDNEALPELILLDLNMPVYSGFDFLNRLEDENLNLSKTRLFILTSSLNPNDVLRASSFPITGYLNKPLTRENLKGLF